MIALTKTPAFVAMGRRTFAFTSFAEVSAAWCEARDKTNVGSRRAPNVRICAEDGTVVAHVSYNGRVWAGDINSWKSGDKPIYDNAMYA